MRYNRTSFQKIVSVSLEKIRDGKIKPFYKVINFRMIFDINMDGKFTRKASSVTVGNMDNQPLSVTYSNLLLRYSFRIGFLLALIKDLYI